MVILTFCSPWIIDFYKFNKKSINILKQRKHCRKDNG